MFQSYHIEIKNKQTQYAYLCNCSWYSGGLKNNENRSSLIIHPCSEQICGEILRKGSQRTFGWFPFILRSSGLWFSYHFTLSTLLSQISYQTWKNCQWLWRLMQSGSNHLKGLSICLEQHRNWEKANSTKGGQGSGNGEGMWGGGGSWKAFQSVWVLHKS